jgi:hypothetical protein
MFMIFICFDARFLLFVHCLHSPSARTPDRDGVPWQTGELVYVQQSLPFQPFAQWRYGAKGTAATVASSKQAAMQDRHSERRLLPAVARWRTLRDHRAVDRRTMRWKNSRNIGRELDSIGRVSARRKCWVRRGRRKNAHRGR